MKTFRIGSIQSVERQFFSLSVPQAQSGYYTVEYKTNLTNASWVQLTNFTANATNGSVMDILSNSSSKFYRVNAGSVSE